MDGSVVSYCGADPIHIRQGRFQFILDNHPVEFTVTTEEGNVFGVDLATGSFKIDDSIAVPDYVPPGELRLIYYKHMTATPEAGTRCEYFVVGYQATVDGRNEKLGMKVFPESKQWTVSSDI